MHMRGKTFSRSCTTHLRINLSYEIIWKLDFCMLYSQKTYFSFINIYITFHFFNYNKNLVSLKWKIKTFLLFCAIVPYLFHSLWKQICNLFTLFYLFINHCIELCDLIPYFLNDFKHSPVACSYSFFLPIVLFGFIFSLLVKLHFKVILEISHLNFVIAYGNIKFIWSVKQINEFKGKYFLIANLCILKFWFQIQERKVLNKSR